MSRIRDTVVSPFAVRRSPFGFDVRRSTHQNAARRTTNLERQKSGFLFEPLLFPGGWFQIQDPDPAAGGVVAAAVVLDRRAPGLERPHLEGVALEVLAGVVQDLVGVP